MQYCFRLLCEQHAPQIVGSLFILNYSIRIVKEVEIEV